MSSLKSVERGINEKNKYCTIQIALFTGRVCLRRHYFILLNMKYQNLSEVFCSEELYILPLMPSTLININSSFGSISHGEFPRKTD